MSLNCEYKDIEWSRCSVDKVEETVCDTDMIVPDSQCDVAKIISVKAFPSVYSCDCASGRLTVTGEVKFNVLYIGDEETPHINTITKSASFTHVCMSQNLITEMLCIAEAQIKTCSFSIVNSRRLKVSAALDVYMRAFENIRNSALVNAEGAEYCSREIKTTCMRAITRKEITVNENADLPAGKPPITDILRCQATAQTESKALNNKLIVKGSALVSILYSSESSICDAGVEIPFTEVLECEGMSPSLDCNVNVTVSACEVSPDTDLSGEYKTIYAAIVLCVTVLASKSDTTSVVTDAYLPHCSLSTERATIDLTPISEEICEEEFIKESLSLASYPPILRIFDLSACILDFKCDNSGVISGNVGVTLLYFSTDTSNPIVSYSGKVSFSHRINDADYVCKRAVLNHASYSITSSNEVEIRLSIGFCVSPSKKEEVSVFTSVEQESVTESDRASILILFVSEGDTLWSVAKSHNIKVSDLACANAISPDTSLKKGEKLIIPR